MQTARIVVVVVEQVVVADCPESFPIAGSCVEPQNCKRGTIIKNGSLSFMVANGTLFVNRKWSHISLFKLCWVLSGY